MTASIPFDSVRDRLLQDDEIAAHYFEEALESGDPVLLKLALKNLARARKGGMARLATETGLNREQLYRTLSQKGNPRLDTLNRIVEALGFKLSVTPLKT